jgi:signal transduction histidine kinase
MKIRLKTKLILLFSVLMAVTLSLQYYFMTRAQDDVLAEFHHISESINRTTSMFFPGKPEERVPASGPGKKTFHRNFPPNAAEDSFRITVAFDAANTDVDSEEFVFSFSGKSGKSATLRSKKTFSGTGGVKTFSLSSDSLNYWVDVDIRKDSAGEDNSFVTVKKVFRGRLPHPPGPPPFTVMVPGFARGREPRFLRYRYDLSRLSVDMEKARNRNLIILLVLFVLSVGVIIIIARSIEKPVHDLRNGFRRVVEGESDVTVEVKSKDEIGELAASFNYMAAELKKNRDKEKLLNRKERFAAIGQLAAGVAHEIKNPLNAINLTISHLKDNYIDEKNEKVLRYIETISAEISRLDKTVNAFLNYTRAENLKKEETDINELLSQVVNLYEREIAHNGIDLKLNFGKPFISYVDPERLKTALVNIILNAIQAMPEGGKLTLETNPDRGEITVNDTGQGIPEKNLENVFDLYYTTKSGGTGLGLPTAYKIVRAHGGDLEISGAEGKGTTVLIRLENNSANRKESEEVQV